MKRFSNKLFKLKIMGFVLILFIIGSVIFLPLMSVSNSSVQGIIDYEIRSEDIQSNKSSSIYMPVRATQDFDDYSSVKEIKEFRLAIPSINLNMNVVENVDPADESVYGAVMVNNIAHGKYTRLPDEATLEGNVYLFAHREGVVGGKDVGFFQNLNELSYGDIALIKYGDKIYKYRFRKSFVITPQDTWVYTGQSNSPTLTLQTCEDGESKRLIVKLDLIEVS